MDFKSFGIVENIVFFAFLVDIGIRKYRKMDWLTSFGMRKLRKHRRTILLIIVRICTKFKAIIAINGYLKTEMLKFTYLLTNEPNYFGSNMIPSDYM